ncbi:phage holin family protein [Actinosynnema sp. NPDC050436]|uniref:phage holin family protein n=1 Tax=Actinosynnema sp. NPDC050436 TaxID=3155659 RepID=UPI0033F7A508
MSGVTSARENTNGSALPPVPSIPLTAESAAGIAQETSIGGLVRDATSHLSTLVRAEVELAKSEITGEVKKGLKGSVYFIVALTILLFSSFFFFFFAAELLAEWLPRWASFLIVFGVMLLGVGAFAFLGYRKLKKLRAPTRTIESAKDTVAALTHRGDES